MQQRKAEIKIQKFDLSCDDSSDEEVVDEKVNSYQINEAWQRYKKSKVKSSQVKVEDELLSFISHAAGIQLLYSKKINLIYYQEKQKCLNFSKVNSSQQLIDLTKLAIDSSYKTAEKAIRQFMSNAKQTKFSGIELDTIFSDTLKDIKSITDNHIHESILAFITWVIENRYRDYISEPEIIQKLQSSFIELFISNYLKKLNLQPGNDNREVIKKKLTELAMAEFYQISKKYSFATKENVDGKKEAIALLESYKGAYLNLRSAIIDVLKQCNARGYVENMLIKKLEEGGSDVLMTAYISDLLTFKSRKLHTDTHKLLKEYFSFTQESVTDELKTHLQVEMKANFKNIIKYFLRDVLARNHVFISNNPYQFYANLRLSNRSQKRHILNLKYSLFKNDSASRAWRFSQQNPNVADVLETQEISSLSSARKDMVLDTGNYEKVAHSINQLKILLSLSDDKIIARWVRATFKGEQITFSPYPSLNLNILGKIQAITYLLFGCEAMRNPAMIVINQMLLDLIIDSSWTFEGIFTQEAVNFMPMIPEGAVSVARGLESDLRKFMPYSYIYHGIEEKNETNNKFSKPDLIRAEANIVRSWLTLNNYSLKKITSDSSPRSILEMIVKHYTNWFAFTEREEAAYEFKK